MQGAAQMLFWQLCEQHWELSLQGWPFGWQPPWQVPPRQYCEQHWALVWHWRPDGVQGCPQTPFWQLCEQHSALFPQPSPLALHPPLLLELCGFPLALLLIPPAPEPLEDAADELEFCAPELTALDPPDPALALDE